MHALVSWCARYNMFLTFFIFDNHLGATHFQNLITYGPVLVVIEVKGLIMSWESSTKWSMMVKQQWHFTHSRSKIQKYFIHENHTMEVINTTYSVKCLSLTQSLTMEKNTSKFKHTFLQWHNNILKWIKNIQSGHYMKKYIHAISKHFFLKTTACLHFIIEALLTGHSSSIIPKQFSTFLIFL